MAGAAVFLLVNSGASYEYACRMYLKELSDEILRFPGASVLQIAIRLSISSLAAEWESRELAEYSESELYTSLSVVENQQLTPVSVLSRMWNVSETKAETICADFSMMSLTKISVLLLGDGEQCGLLIHDLHLEYCRQNATRGGDGRLWHRRLLDGLMTADVSRD